MGCVTRLCDVSFPFVFEDFDDRSGPLGYEDLIGIQVAQYVLGKLQASHDRSDHAGFRVDLT